MRPRFNRHAGFDPRAPEAKNASIAAWHGVMDATSRDDRLASIPVPPFLDAQFHGVRELSQFYMHMHNTVRFRLGL
jgi:hypothetical protein